MFGVNNQILGGGLKMKRKTRIILFLVMLVGVIASNWVISNSSFGQPTLLQYGNKTGMLDFKFYYTQSEASSALLSLGQEGANIYRRILLVDFIFIICIAYVLGEFMRMLIKWLKLPDKYNRLSWLAYIRSGFDAAENILILIVLALLPAGQWLLGITGVVTLLKFVSMAAYLLAILFLLFMKLIKSRKHS
jgi:hypothetical protein